MVIAITTTDSDCCNKVALISADLEEDIAMYRHPFVKAYIIGRGKGEKEDKRKTYTERDARSVKKMCYFNLFELPQFQEMSHCHYSL